jgi:hypothetical protein
MRKSLPGEALTCVLLGVALFCAYLVMHPYRGIHGDALIYVTRAWAPSAIADGDMLFAHDRQTSFTLYGLVLRMLLRVMPVAEAARAMSLAGAAFWFCGLACFAHAATRAARLPISSALAMCALVVLAPLGYSAGSSFAAGEVLAVPRPFSEAFVLMSFAALLHGRIAPGVLALVVATLFHPLIALAGASVAFMWAALADRRLWLAAAAACVVAIVAAIAGVPVLSDLLATFDADWLALLRMRTSYLFLSQAPLSFWTDLVLRAVILAIAARVCEPGRLRSFFVAVLLAGAAGVAMSLLFADFWPSVLVTQVQPWRVLFVFAIVAPAAIVPIAMSGQGARIGATLALIACAYMTRDADLLSACFSLAALAVQFNARLGAAMTPVIVKAFWLVAAAAWVAFDLANMIAFGRMLADAPHDFAPPWSYVWPLRPFALPLFAWTVFLAMRGRLPRPSHAALVAIVACAIAFLRFDDRAAVDRSLEARQAPELAATLPKDGAPVLWLGQGKEPWYWLDRANWAAPVQASSIVFSRDLAGVWSERARFLMDQKIFTPGVLTNQPSPIESKVTPEAVAAVCGRADGPSAIVAPIMAGDATPENARRVAAPAPSYSLRVQDGLRFEKSDSFAIWTCRPEPRG